MTKPQAVGRVNGEDLFSVVRIQMPLAHAEQAEEPTVILETTHTSTYRATSTVAIS